MDIGVTIRNMGEESSADLVLACARTAEAAGMESVWITDHVAIPPDDAEGSGGRYLDTLTTLAWLGGATAHIKLGAGVLILPYRPMLPTARQVATLQELTSNRLLLGVGVGWMDAEFRALGVERKQRGRITDATLAFFNEAFSNDVVELNGQPFLFKPRPPKPPILVGGAPPHALRRAVELGDGWMPMAKNPAQIIKAVGEYRKLTAELGKPPGNVTVLTYLPLDEPDRAKALLDGYRAMEVDRVVAGLGYSDIESYSAQLEILADITA
ncbi:MAG: TIGR03619 family F420-dependent LLM class oxidoreductase [Halioglobus sp.]|nr:TIGR03619 family F420-dependent LLM class oxidoreductase [Halioglobus sp.]